MDKKLEEMTVTEIQSLLCLQYEDLNRVQENIRILQDRRAELNRQAQVKPIVEPKPQVIEPEVVKEK